MPFKYSSIVSRSKVAISVLAFACAFSATAGAQSRAAPIVYKNDTMNAAASFRMAQAPAAPAARPAQSAPLDKATARIEFRYPDSQLVAASAQSAPIAPSARESMFTEAPQYVSPVTPPVETVALQAMPELAGQGMGYTPLVPVVQPTAPADENSAFSETGLAIVYGDEFAGLPTANGEIFSQGDLTAAHPSLPLPSLVSVRNIDTGREVVVRVNDRGPFEDGAAVQLSRKAAEALGISATGKGTVSLRYVSAAPVAAVAPISQAPVPQRVASPPAPAVTPAVQPVVSQMVSAPVSAEDELLGGGLAAAPAPRLMSMTVTPPAPAYAAPASGTGNVFVQLASFSDIGNAEAMLRNVEGSLPVEIVPARVNGADFFRVRVGPFQDHAAAEQIRANLSLAGTADGRIVTGY